MNVKTLPKSVTINNLECSVYSDYRDILQVFEILNDPDLLDGEKMSIALDYFYQTEEYKEHYDEAIKQMLLFITMGEKEPDNNETERKPLYDWEQDFNLIVSPINKNLGYDVRGVEYLHWWTFLSSFMEIGECTFNTFVGIRNKLNKNIKLDKVEERIYRENKDKITLKKKYDTVTQNLMDEIMGRA